MIEVLKTQHRLFKSSRPGYPNGDHGPVVGERCVNDTIARWKSGGITHILCLQPDEEQLRQYGKRLTRWYRREGLHVIEFPIGDFGVPRLDQIIPIVRKARTIIMDEGNRLLVHCSAGMGRTGMMLSCLAMYMRKHGPFKDMPLYNPQTKSQRDAVEDVARSLGFEEDASALFHDRTDDPDRGGFYGFGIREEHDWDANLRFIPPPTKNRESGTSPDGRSIHSGRELRVRVQDGGESRHGVESLPQHREEGIENTGKGKVDSTVGSPRPPDGLSNKGRKGIPIGQGCWTEDGWEEGEEELKDLPEFPDSNEDGEFV